MVRATCDSRVGACEVDVGASVDVEADGCVSLVGCASTDVRIVFEVEIKVSRGYTDGYVVFFCVFLKVYMGV